MLTVIRPKDAYVGSTETVSLLQYRVEHRRGVARRGIDDLQHLGGRGLALQRLITLGSAFGKLALKIGDHLLKIGQGTPGGRAHLRSPLGVLPTRSYLHQLRLAQG